MSKQPFTFTQPWRTAVFLLFAGLFNYADRKALSAVLPSLQAEFGLSNAALGLLSTLFLWSYALGSPVAGFIGDRFPRRNLVLASLVAWSAITVLTGLARDIFWLAVLRVALGFAQCIYIPAAVALLAELHGQATRGRAMNLAFLGISMGSIVGGTLSGAMADSYGWRSGFWVLGMAGFVLAVIARPFLGAAPVLSQPATASQRVSFGEAFAYFLSTRTYLVLLSSTGLVSLGIWIFAGWLPFYFREKYQMNMGTAGFHGTFILSAFSMLGISIGGWLSDHVVKINPRWRLLLLASGYFLAAPFLLGFVAGLPFQTLYVFIALFSTIRSMGGANETPVLCDVIPSVYRASAQGLMNASALAAGGLGILLTGILKAGVGLETIFAGVSITFLLAAALYFVGYFFWIERDSAQAKLKEEELRLAKEPVLGA